MRRFSAPFAGASFAAALRLACGVGAQTIDKAGNCHAKDGKLAKMEVCKPASMAKAGPCKDPKTGKFTACPAKSAAPAVKPAVAAMAKPAAATKK
jgi:hypothetical protein